MKPVRSLMLVLLAIATMTGGLAALQPPVEQPGVPEGCVAMNYGLGYSCTDSRGAIAIHRPDGSLMGILEAPHGMPHGTAQYWGFTSPRAPFCARPGELYYTQLLYATPVDGINNYATLAPRMLNAVRLFNQMIDDASLVTGGGHGDLRVLCDQTGQPLVTPTVLKTPAAMTTPTTLIADVQANGYTVSQIHYLVLFDSPNPVIEPNPAYGCGGVGGRGMWSPDDSPSSANANNGVDLHIGYGIYYAPRDEPTGWCYQPDYLDQILFHELMHEHGAVQNTPPHATGGAHCTDGLDSMCYNDGAINGWKYNTNACSNTMVFDCNKDDYCDRTPFMGGYLATHWNLCACYHWFFEFPACGPITRLPTCPPPQVGTPPNCVTPPPTATSCPPGSTSAGPTCVPQPTVQLGGRDPAGAVFPTCMGYGPSGPWNFMVSHGTDANGVDTNDVACGNAGTQAWVTMPSAIVARSQAAGVASQTPVAYWVFGGKGPSCTGGTTGDVCDVIERLDPAGSPGWSIASFQMPNPAAGLGAATDMMKLYTFGGRDCNAPYCDTTPSTDLTIYDPANGNAPVNGPPMPVARADLAVAIDHGGACPNFYVVGGNQGSGADLPTVDRLTTCGMFWTPSAIAPMPKAVSNAVAGWCGGKLVVVGGTNNGVPANVVQRYDPTSGTWTQTPMANARYRLAVSLNDDYVAPTDVQLAAFPGDPDLDQLC